MHQEPWYVSFTGYIERVNNIPRVLNMPEFWIYYENNLKNNFKFKYPKETLKNKICLECIQPETWILFLALNNIHFLRVLGNSLEIMHHPQYCLKHHPGIFSNITNATHFRKPSMPPMLAHCSLYPYWRTPQAGTSP